MISTTRHKERAAALSKVLEPLIAAHLAETERPAPVTAVQKRDPAAVRVIDAAVRVAKAVDKLDQAKFSPAEIPARRALEKAARRLRTTVEETRHG